MACCGLWLVACAAGEERMGPDEQSAASRMGEWGG